MRIVDIHRFHVLVLIIQCNLIFYTTGNSNYKFEGNTGERSKAAQNIKEYVNENISPDDGEITSSKTNNGMYKQQPGLNGDVKFNDPLYVDQWYLHGEADKKHLSNNHINVVPVWNSGISGKGIRICVLDDGVCGQNPEVAKNFDPLITGDFVDIWNASEIPENSHGTYCAAISSGVANNKYCGVGVAFDAKIGGARVLSDYVTDAQEAMGLVNALDIVDVYTASWGPEDDGKHVDGPGKLARMALKKGVTEGRGGKGAIYVWASGNGGHHGDHCGLDGYASSPYTLTFGALTRDGKSSYYSEACASVLASAYVGGFHVAPKKNGHVHQKNMINVIVPEANGKCRKNFQGTSAAAPIAGGVIALMLEANNNLTWRDVQHLIVNTVKVPLTSESGWSMNAAGRFFHPKIGFGAIDAALAVDKAKTWSPVPPSREWMSTECTERKLIGSYEITMIVAEVNKPKPDVVETVVATVNVVHSRCGNLEFLLISPFGTVSQILAPRTKDNVTKKFQMWEFSSLHFWGESSHGAWTLQILDTGRNSYSEGFIDYFQLKFYGIEN